jgi:CheY-like chemotaxis protein
MAKILIVEDEGIVALDIQARLEGLGYEVPAILATGEEAIRTAVELQPDLVLMDIRLRGELDGLQAAEQIRVRCGIPIVFLTASTDLQTSHRGRHFEQAGWLGKPVETTTLGLVIEEALQIYEQGSRLGSKESDP